MLKPIALSFIALSALLAHTPSALASGPDLTQPRRGRLFCQFDKSQADLQARANKIRYP